jgi:cytochrome b
MDVLQKETRQGGEEAPPMLRLLIWDLPTRLFHWMLVVLVVSAWGSAQAGWFVVHFWSGYGVITLVLFRLFWGVWGSDTSRFRHFVKGPAAAFEHLSALLAAWRRPDHALPPHPGHNPAGGLMVLVLLGIVALQAGTGLFASDDIVLEGPFYALVSERLSAMLSTIHRINANLMVPFIGLHVAAVVAYKVIWKQNLLRAMVTGFHEFPAPAISVAPTISAAPTIVSPTIVSLWRAVVAAGVAAGAVTLLITKLPALVG